VIIQSKVWNVATQYGVALSRIYVGGPVPEWTKRDLITHYYMVASNLFLLYALFTGQIETLAM
jgi:hypothetical protein